MWRCLILFLLFMTGCAQQSVVIPRHVYLDKAKYEIIKEIPIKDGSETKQVIYKIKD